MILLLALAPAYAGIYKWVDRNGRVHFTDTIASIPPEYRDHIEEKASLLPTPPRVTSERPAIAPTPTPPNYAVPLRRDGNDARTTSPVGAAICTRDRRTAARAGSDKREAAKPVQARRLA